MGKYISALRSTWGATFKNEASARRAIRLSGLWGGHVPAAFDADTAGANDTRVIALRPQLARHRGFVMTDRKLSAPISNARRIAVSTIAATLLSATGFSVDTAVAQQPQPPTTPPRPAAPPPPAAPTPPPPAP